MERKKFKWIAWCVFAISAFYGLICYGVFYEYGTGLLHVIARVFFGISIMCFMALAVVLSFPEKEPPKVLSPKMLRSILWKMRIRVSDEVLYGGDLLRNLPHLITTTEANVIVATLVVLGFEVSEKDFNELLYMRNRGWDIIGKHDAEAREFKEVGLEELETLAKEAYGKKLHELTTKQILLIVKVVKFLGVPVTAPEELGARLKEIEKRTGIMKQKREGHERGVAISDTALGDLTRERALKETVQRKLHNVMAEIESGSRKSEEEE